MSLDFETLIYTIPGILLSFALHEYAHGLVSYQLGDPTPKLDGRLTLNPLKHLDPFGALSLLLFGFGWAKPVHVDARYYKDPKNDMVKTAFAGPMINLIEALICILIAVFMEKTLPILDNDFLFYVWMLLRTTALLAIGLGIFNLLPVPPLDGSKILYGLLKEETYFKLLQYEQMLSVLLIAVLFTGVLNGPLMSARSAIYVSFEHIARLIFFFL